MKLTQLWQGFWGAWRGVWWGLSALALSLTLSVSAAFAEGERAGEFDYYVLSLSWSPAYCALEGPRAAREQCRLGLKRSFVVHGLWPQNERGWPSYCRTRAKDPTRGQTQAMAGLMGGAGAAFYQWKKHGRCSGLSAPDYFQTTRAAFDRVVIPPLFERVTQRLRLPASVIEEAFLEVNPDFERDGVTVTCDAGLIREVRICLDKSLEPRRCGADVIRDCRLKDAQLEVPR